ncbi:MAG: GNAT family N-acetyltransferase, partial [Bacteroidaceae bacterium]|nr:GNAT family N-acetyltransferase [Bacteroidaceae bacterium]
METERLTLRPWLDTDADALFRYASEPDIGNQAGWPPHKSVDESREIIRTVFNSPTVWAIVLKETGEPIGSVGYMESFDLNIPARPGEAMASYWVAKP